MSMRLFYTTLSALMGLVAMTGRWFAPARSADFWATIAYAGLLALLGIAWMPQGSGRRTRMRGIWRTCRKCQKTAKYPSFTEAMAHESMCEEWHPEERYAK